jgi:hypothetical protein
LSVDQVVCGRVDGGDAVEMAEDRVLGSPEADRAGDRLSERRIGVGDLDGLAELEECGVLAAPRSSMRGTTARTA